MRIHRIHALIFDSFFSRARGLIGRTQLLQTQGALITPCKAVHTLGMDIDIDVVFVDRALTVVTCVEHVRPNRFARARTASVCSTLELKAGEIRRLAIVPGDQIKLCVLKENRYARQPA